MIHKQSVRILFLLLSLCAVLPAIADEARFRLVERRYTWNGDGSMDFRFRKELTLFTHTAMNSTYGETFIAYNPAYQTLTINESYTRQADGTVVRSPENAFVEVLPSAAADAPAFNGLREMVVVHTGLELGATICLDYTLHTKSGYLPFVEASGLLQETSPVECCRLVVDVPGGLSEDNMYVNAAGRSVRKARKGNTLTWEFRNLPALSREPFRLSDHRDDVFFTFSAADNVRRAEALRERFAEEPSPVLRHWADSLTRSSHTAADKVKALRTFLAKGMADSRVPDALAGYARPRTSDDVLRSAYATAPERARLMATLCRAAGVEAEVAAVYPAFLPPAVRGLAAVKEWCVVWKDASGARTYCNTQHPSAGAGADRTTLDVVVTADGRTVDWPKRADSRSHTYELQASKGRTTGPLVLLTLEPSADGPSGWGMGRLASMRVTTMELPATANECDTYTVAVGDGLRWLPGERNFRVANACGEMTQTVTETAAGLQVVRKLVINRRTVKPADYAAVRRLLIEWTDENRRTLVFEKK